ncbi:Putative glycosyl transferase, family 8, nucleotide-diphospho-sugar transferase [Colletotrichum destructivum]|uniref:glycogenin glucosyltransferase n=1 Tax=Colletotrichum destructivum TaxID=34406 RepID=A0AAX4J2N0_9PEZI|nr:Putative glycosyl transferase, family 8, nucleotide-diphospho-sugar transferase [Colletotrichum destructivum]
MATLREGEQVYATLLLNDTYLPGALVLAHSLRDAGTSKQLVVLVTLDTISAEVITELRAVYDHVIPVPRIRNSRPANLYLMNRPDLHSAFTKVNLWRQTQFSKIVYIDADVVAYRAPDELFDVNAPFSAAPDIGWPDLFNTGVMVLKPNMGDYYALMAMAERGISFDGADQGLLNMHFKNTYNRISFTYNVTPSAHYQYVPAYRHFQSSINMVHFIGPDKPWFQGRKASKGDSPFEDMIGRWWAVYDRHYRVAEAALASLPEQQQKQHHQEQQASEIVQYFTKGEFQPQLQAVQAASSGEHPHGTQVSHSRDSTHFQMPPPLFSGHEVHDCPSHNAHDPGSSRLPPHREQPHVDHDEKSQPEIAYQAGQPFPPPSESLSGFAGTQAEARSEQVSAHQRQSPTPPPVEQTREPSPPPPAWDAQRQPPPADSRPEALNFPSQTYEMSQDPAPFVPPERYPSPPRNMWYEVPKQKPNQKPRPLFPWEINQPKPTRVFTAGQAESEADESSSAPTSEQLILSLSQASAEPSRVGSSTTGQKSEPSTPATPTIRVSPSDPWTTFARTNAWDEVPEIERYVEGLQKHHRGKSQGSVGLSGETTVKEHGLKLTDFPSVVERPSLPVTPAPIRRPKFWGGGPGPGDGDDDEELPMADGVPPQSDWDPSAQLQKLAKQQSEALLKKLGGGEGGPEGSAAGKRQRDHERFAQFEWGAGIINNCGNPGACQFPGTVWERGEEASLEGNAGFAREGHDVLDALR